MKLSYDPKANVAYIRLRERQGDVETISVTSDFLVDIDATGSYVEPLRRFFLGREGRQGRRRAR